MTVIFGESSITIVSFHSGSLAMLIFSSSTKFEFSVCLFLLPLLNYKSKERGS